MHNDPIVLRAMLRLARRRVAVDAAAHGHLLLLFARASGTDGTGLDADGFAAAELRASLRRRERAGLVVRTGDESARLTLAGLAVAAAASARPARATPRSASSRAARAGGSAPTALPARRRAA